MGPRVFQADPSAGGFHRLLNREHLDRAHAFFERHGGKAVVLDALRADHQDVRAVRGRGGGDAYATFALVQRRRGAVWVGTCVGAGYLFGNVPVIKNNFSLVALGIVAVSLLPVLVEWLKHRKRGRHT